MDRHIRLYNFFCNAQYTDMDIYLRDSVLSVHKVVMAAASPYLEEVVDCSTGHISVHFPSYSTNVFMAFVRYAYLGDVLFPTRLREKVMVLARLLGVEAEIRRGIPSSMERPESDTDSDQSSTPMRLPVARPAEHQ